MKCWNSLKWSGFIHKLLAFINTLMRCVLYTVETNKKTQTISEKKDKHIIILAR